LPALAVAGIMLLWVNLHPGFIAGLGAIGAYLLMEFLRFCVASGARRCAYGYGGHGLARGWRRVTLVNPWGPRIYAAALKHGRRRWFESGKDQWQQRDGEFMAYPYQPICCISSSMCGTLSSALPGCFCWRRILAAILFWKRQAAPVGYGCGTLCRIESCAVFGAVRNLRRNFGCGALEALFDERPDGSAKK